MGSYNPMTGNYLAENIGSKNAVSWPKKGLGAAFFYFYLLCLLYKRWRPPARWTPSANNRCGPPFRWAAPPNISQNISSWGGGFSIGSLFLPQKLIILLYCLSVIEKMVTCPSGGTKPFTRLICTFMLCRLAQCRV